MGLYCSLKRVLSQFSQQTMIEYLLTGAIFLISWLVHACIIKPKREMANYARQFESKGFKVYVIPFKFMSIPFLETLFRDERENHDSLKFMKEVYPHYDVVISNYLNSVLIDCLDFQLLKSVYSSPELYPKMEMFMNPFKRVFGEGLVVVEGQQWKQRRKILNRIFTFEMMKAQAQKIAKICDTEIVQLIQESKIKEKNGQQIIEFDLLDLTNKIASIVVLEGFCGVKIKNQRINNVPVSKLLTQFGTQCRDQSFQILPSIFGIKFFDLGIFSSHREFNRRVFLYKNWCNDTLKKKIKECQQRLNENNNDKKQPEDIIEAILLDKRKNKEQSERYTEKAVIDEFNTFFLAGGDSTSNFLVSTIYLILSNPQVEKKVRNQIQQYMRTDDFSYDNLKNLRYIDWILKQVVRHAGPIPLLLLRNVKVPHLLNGIRISSGTKFIIAQKAGAFSDRYFKDPENFRPERWENECNEVPSLASIGFSAGPRSCIGKNLALLELKIATVKIFKRFRHIKLEKENYPMLLKFSYAPVNVKLIATII